MGQALPTLCNFHPSGWLRASALTCRLISLVGVKWSCLRIDKRAFPPRGGRAEDGRQAETPGGVLAHGDPRLSVPNAPFSSPEAPFQGVSGFLQQQTPPFLTSRGPFPDRGGRAEWVKRADQMRMDGTLKVDHWEIRTPPHGGLRGCRCQGYVTKFAPHKALKSNCM